MHRRRTRRSYMDRKCIETQVIDDILIVKFLVPALSTKVFNELDKILAPESETDPVVPLMGKKGVVFTSDNSKLFLAGADLFEIKQALDGGDETVARQMIARGQEMYNRIEGLSIPTVAAINGMCLGGGYELSLACDYRVAANNKNVKVGLPEVNLGILPAWGGCTRLVPLIGLQESLTAILSGKLYAPKPALKKGLIDRVCHKENLVTEAINLINNPLTRKSRTNWLPSPLIFKVAHKNVFAKTKGNYPAPFEILEVIKKGIEGSKKTSLKLEEDAFIKLAKTSECKNLMRIFFLQEASKKLKWKEIKVGSELHSAVVVGAGVMGAGIAQWLSCKGTNVLLKDVNQDSIDKGLNQIGKLYVQGVRGHKFDRPAARDGLAKITTTTDELPLHNYDLIVEAVVEKLDVKQKVLTSLEAQAGKNTIIATNTSALSIDEMAESLQRPEKFVGIHFFNPVHKMKLVEIVRGSKTSDETVARAVKYVQRLGKLPIVVKDRPGFVVNRVLVPYLVQAAELLDHGYDIEAVDKVMVDFGMPMGPFRLMDEIGLSVCYHVADDLRQRLGTDSAGINQLVNRIGQNKLGKQSGEGFYKYKNGRAIRNKVTQDASAVVDVLVRAMVTESNTILEEGVIEHSDDLDFAMIMGTGWAPFRGGPIRYGRSLWPVVVERLVGSNTP